MFENALAGGQQDYWNNAARDSEYIGGTSTGTNLYSQQLATYNAPLMSGGKRRKGQRKTRKGQRRGQRKTRRRRRGIEEIMKK